MKVFDVRFQIYAESEQGVNDLRLAIIRFINQHREQNRAVTAEKVASAINQWDKNYIVRNKIIDFLK